MSLQPPYEPFTFLLRSLTYTSTTTMADPLLSSLCTICHIHTPKYTCPRCSVQTCSLPCVRRHKLWSSCSGTRDPTIYKPRSELLTPSGVDHDYNFLHGIEHQIQRSEKEIVEERGIIHRDELKDARLGKQDGRPHGPSRSKSKQAPGEECIKAMLKMMGTRVHRAPKGMQRNAVNGTSWSKNNRQINWQVEWMRNAGTTRQLGKVLNHKSIAYHYDEWYEEDRRSRMTEEERRALKKRKAVEIKDRATKRARHNSNLPTDLTISSRLQDPGTGAWRFDSPSSSQTNLTPAFSPDTYCRINNHQLYLLRPLTSSKFPKILVPIEPNQPLSEILQKRDVVEFPTIYVFEEPIASLPVGFMLEEEYLVATGQSTACVLESGSSGSDSSTDEDEDVEEASSRDIDMEDGEVTG